MTSTEAERALLRASLRQNLRMLPDANLVSEERQRQMAESLEQFCIKAMEKYIRGQREHGDNITTRDLDSEIRNEFFDMFWYSEAKGW